MLDTPIEIASPPNAIVLPTPAGKCEFRGVSLTYQDEKKASLRNIHLHVRPNQVVALIGPTGSGKTSLINLIPRFYDVSEGAVLVDGVDVRRVELSSLRRQIGIVLQTSLLFSDTIRANIACCGVPMLRKMEIIAAAQPPRRTSSSWGSRRGYDTIVGERGVTLSGWSAPAGGNCPRALMNPRILILDDRSPAWIPRPSG